MDSEASAVLHRAAPSRTPFTLSWGQMIDLCNLYLKGS